MSREQRYKNYQLHREKVMSSKPVDDIFAMPEEVLAGDRHDSKYQDTPMYTDSKSARMMRKQKKLKQRDTWS